ncbi:unnamed protein product [Cochlearia groenlandica]
MSQINLPFKVGDVVEAKTFEIGFRGAWFRCKIIKIFMKGITLYYNLEYLDYPDEGIHETKVFQRPEGGDQNVLMIRPPYPRVCQENEVLSKKAGVEEAVVVHDAWKVGDLVDWWIDYSYWLGTVMEVREDKSVKIELLPEPHGEGDSYEGLSKDLRPSLEWSLEKGWSVLVPKGGENRPCAKLIKLSNEDEVKEGETREEQVQGTARESKGDGAMKLNIMVSETKEAAVNDLEECIVRIEWIKGMLSQAADSFSETSSWKYEDYAPSSKRI